MDDLSRSVKSFITHSNPANHEIEFRFTERGELFSINSETFARILSDTQSKNEMWTFKETSLSKVLVKQNIVKGKPDLRIIQTQTDTIKEIKTRIRTEDRNFRDFNIRASEARETNVDISNEDIAKLYTPKLERNRIRHTFIDKSKIWQLDLTHIESYTDSVLKSTYEIELEYLSKSKLISITNIQSVFTFILKSIQNSDVIISNMFGKQLIGDYCNLLKINPRFPKFIGPLPFTLTKEIFQSGKLSCGYSVTEKADGDRKLLFIGKKGLCLLISRPKDKDLQYQHVGTIPELENSIFDGEFVNNKIYLFDSLIFKSNDIRHLPLDHRLAVFQSFPKEISCKIEILYKTFYFAHEGHIIKIESGKKTELFEDSNIYLISDYIWKTRATFPYKLDGLIYTPILANYYNTNIFKWKDNNTIDFHVIKISDTTWQLEIAGLDADQNYVHIPFEGVDNNGIFFLRKGKNIEEIENLIWKSESPLKTGIIEVSKILAKKFVTNTVVEFKHYGGKFIPIRSRPDKKYANNIRAINDAWESIVDSLTISTIKSGIYRSCTRQYHNSIKKYIINKFSSQRKVLDIGSGAGGDIKKYMNSQVKRLIGIDIVEVEYEHPNIMSFYKVENELYSIKDVIADSKVGKFDTINCHFALHYFFKSNDTLLNLIHNLDENLKTGGLFVVTCMSGENINNLLNTYKITKGKILHAKYKSNTIYKIKKNYKDVDSIDDLSLVNQKIEVKLAGTKYFKEQVSTEYLVNIKKFIELMKVRKYKHIQTTSFSELCKKFPYECQSMNRAEKEFSFLNSYVVFTKE